MKKLMKISLNMFIVSIILIFQIIFSFLFALRYFFTEDNVYNLITNVNVEKIINDSNVDLSKLYEVLSAVKISKEDTNKLLESKSIKRYLSKYICNNIESLKNKKGIIIIEISDIKDVMIYSKNEDINISDESLQLIDENQESLQKYLDMIPNKINDNLSTKTSNLISFLLSGNLFIVYFIVLIFSYLILSLSNLSFKKAFINFGIILSLISLLFIAIFGYALLIYNQDNFVKNIFAFNSLGLLIGLLSININLIIRKIALTKND